MLYLSGIACWRCQLPEGGAIGRPGGLLLYHKNAGLHSHSSAASNPSAPDKRASIHAAECENSARRYIQINSNFQRGLYRHASGSPLGELSRQRPEGSYFFSQLIMPAQPAPTLRWGARPPCGAERGSGPCGRRWGSSRSGTRKRRCRPGSRSDLLHLLAGLSGDEALAGAVVAVLSGVEME